MMTRSIHQILRASACAAGFAVTASFGGTKDKTPEVVTPETHPMYLGTVNTGIKVNDRYTEGNFSVLAPVWSTLGADATLSGGVLFLEPYVSYGEGGEIASSLGLGYRYLFGSQPVSALSSKDARQAGFLEEGFFVGGNLFVDMLDTEANNQFWQLGVGVEFGTRYLEVRGNYYIPLSDKQLADEFRTTETRQSSRTSTANSVTPINDPYASGNTITQDALFATTRTTTTSTTTIERLFRRYEEGMEGWDAEVALLVPGLDKYFDLRVIGGYYSFDNQPFGPQTGGTGNVEGWKAGLEVRPVPAVVLTGTWYEDDRLTGSDWTAGVQLQLPFEMGDLGDGKGFWGRIGDSFKSRRRHLAERMAQNVYRQNTAVKLASTVEQKKVSTSTNVQRVNRVVAQKQGQVILTDDIIFVNNGGAVGNGIQEGSALGEGANGTAERPFDTLTEGSFAAGTNSNTLGRVWNVYTQGNTGLNYEESVKLVGSTNFISSANPLNGLNGYIFGGDTSRPVVDGGIRAEDVGFFGVTGYSFINGYDSGWWQNRGNGIKAENVTKVVVQDNTFDDMRRGVVIETKGGIEASALVSNNTFDDVNTGVKLHTHGRSNLLVDVVDNRFSGDFDAGVDAASFWRSKLDLNVAGNTFAGDVDDAGVKLSSEHRSKIIANIEDNRFFGDYDNAGIDIETEDRSKVFATIIGNLFAGDFRDAGVEVNSDDDSFVKVEIDSNRFYGDYDYGIDIVKEEDSKVVAFITNNIIGGRRSDFEDAGIRLASFGSDDDNSGLWALVKGNTLRGEFDNSGILVESFHGSSLFAGIIGNTLRGDYDDSGIELDASHGSSMYTYIKGNVLRGDFDDAGIEVKSSDGADLWTTIKGNYLVGEFDSNGIEVKSDDHSSLQADIERNLFSGEFDNSGVYAEKEGDSVLEINIERNWFTGEFDNRGVDLVSRDDEDDDSALIATVTGNRFSGYFGNDGIGLNSYDESELHAVIAGNRFTGYFEDAGIDVRKHDRSELEVGIYHNLLLSDRRRGDNYEVGIRLTSEDSSWSRSELNAKVIGNVLAGDFDTGIEVNSDDYAELNAFIGYNTLSGDFDEAGIAVHKEGRSNADVTIKKNRLSGEFDEYGILVVGSDSGYRSELEVNIDGNTLSGDFNNGIYIKAEDRAEVKAFVQNNRLSGDFDRTGITFRSKDDGELNVYRFNNNRIYGDSDRGILLWEGWGSDLRVFGFGSSNRVYNSDDRLDIWGNPSYDFRLNGWHID